MHIRASSSAPLQPASLKPLHCQASSPSANSQIYTNNQQASDTHCPTGAIFAEASVMAKTKAALLYQAYRTQLLFEENKRALNDPAGYGRIWQGGGLHAGSNASGTSAPQSFSPSSSFFSLLYGASILFAPAFTNSPIAGIFAKQKTAAKKQREKGKEKKKQQAP